MRDVILQDISESFSDTYFKARRKFLELAKSVKSYKSPARGPGGEELFTDVAWFGNPDACHVGVLISATHGVESYCGSAGQVDWMRGGNASSLGPDMHSTHMVLRGTAASPKRVVTLIATSWTSRSLFRLIRGMTILPII